MTITEMLKMQLMIWTDVIWTTISLLFKSLDKSHQEALKDLKKMINAINVEELDTGKDI